MAPDLNLFTLWNSLQFIDVLSDPSYNMFDAPEIERVVRLVTRENRYPEPMKAAILLEYAMRYKKLGSPISAMRVLYEILRIRLIPSVISEFYTLLYNYHLHRGSGSTDRVYDALCEDIKIVDDPELSHCQAKMLVQREKYSEAVDILKGLVTKHPRNSTTNRMLASLYSKLGESEEALDVLTKYLKKESKDHIAQTDKGMILLKNGQYREAQKCFEKAVQQDWKNIQYHLLLAATTRLDDFEGSVLNIKRILRGQTDEGKHWREFGVFYSNLSIFDLAAYCFERAIYLNPREPEYVRDLAVAYHKMGQIEKAIAFVESKLEWHNHSERLLRVLADLHLTSGRFNEAEQYARSAIEKNTNDAALYIMLGDILFRKGDHNDSEESFQKAIQIGRNTPEIHVKIGFVYLNNWQIDKAEEQFKQALDMIPNHPDAMKGMKLLQHVSTKKVSLPKIYEQTEAQLKALMSGELPPSKDGHRISINLWDAMVDEDDN